VIEFLGALMGAAAGAAIIGLVRGSRVFEHWSRHRALEKIAAKAGNVFCDKCGRWFNARDGWHQGPLA
jgi:hypothetical protein